MPGPSVHLRFVRDTIERWDRDGGAPVDLDATAVVDALHAGSVAPDMGYYPGAHPFISDLAHYLKTGALARSLLSEADSPIEEAFAWGWISHLVADVFVHPAVNEAAGVLRGDPGALTFADDPAAHMQVEMGLDAFFDARYGTPPVHDVLDGEVAFVQRAYARTYGVDIPAVRFRATFAAGARFQGPFRAVARLTHAAFPTRSVSGKVAGVGLAAGNLLARAVAGGSVAAGLFRGVEPSGMLLAAVENGRFEYHVRMGRLVAQGPDDLPDYNLDTGLTGPSARSYRLAVMAEQQLNKYKGI